MIIELTPEIFFEQINKEGPLHVVMHYGATCGPCKATIEYKQFIEDNNLKTNGVPTFRYYYMGEKLHEVTSGYGDPNNMKKVVMEVIEGIEQTMGSFDLYAS